MKRVLDTGFDWILYPAVLVWLGTLWGGITMTALSVIVNIGLIRAYDWSKTDWLMLETLKGLRDSEPIGKRARFISKILKLSDPLAIIALSIYDDPFTTTLYMRRGGHQYNGMSQRDWRIFFASTIIANLFWTVGWTSVIYLFKWISS